MTDGRNVLLTILALVAVALVVALALPAGPDSRRGHNHDTPTEFAQR